MRSIDKQLHLANTSTPTIRGRGGRRPGAGRPRVRDEGIAHRRRPPLSPKVPVHVTLRMSHHVFNLRSARCFRVVECALFATANGERARIVHFSVQGNHMHMLVEADDERALSHCMRSLGIRLGRGLNSLMRSKGQVIAHRYHARALRTPTEVYRALGYVRHNHAIHARRRGVTSAGATRQIDRYSSDALLSFAPPRPRTWLLSDGWKRGVPRSAKGYCATHPPSMS